MKVRVKLTSKTRSNREKVRAIVVVETPLGISSQERVELCKAISENAKVDRNGLLTFVVTNDCKVKVYPLK